VAAEHGQPRFLLGGDDLEADAGLAPDPVDEMAAVDRAPAGLGRDRTGERDPAPPKLLGADRERGYGAVHRRFGKLAGGRHALAHPDEAAQIVVDNGGQDLAHQKYMMGEVAKLTAGGNGVLDEKAYERTAKAVLDQKIISAPPSGAWTHDITDAAGLK